MADASPQDVRSTPGTFQKNFFFPGSQKSKDTKESSDSEDEDPFDGEKLKTKLLSVWNNVRYGMRFCFKLY